MVIRPVVEGASQGSGRTVSAWEAVEKAQRAEAAEYWLIPQPAHAALAGEIAAKLRPELFGTIEATAARAIALHDAGWSLYDAGAIQELHSPGPKIKRPLSFLDAPPAEIVKAWTGSIDTAEKFAPIGGYLVSRHFERLAESPLGAKEQAFRPFVAREKKRQQRLLAKLKQSETELERLVDALQFCDLLSLYLCCGTQQNAMLRAGKVEVEAKVDKGEYSLSPSPLTGPQQFSFPALHLVLEGKRPGVGGASSEKKGGSAVFYINL